MKRNTLALAAGVALALGSSVLITADASFVKTSATMMMQGQSASRWQPDRFGPIVSSDTLWSIAMYYGDKSDLSVYEMMDLFIELNPHVFINGRADQMMDGYYLKVPKIAQQAAKQKQPLAQVSGAKQPVSTASSSVSQPVVTPQPASQPSAQPSGTAAQSASQSQSQSQSTPVASATDAVSFSVEELTTLRNQLAESTALIERLNTENANLQSRLDAVTRELDELQKRIKADQVAEDDLQEQIAAELAASSVTSEQGAVVNADNAARIVSETEAAAKQAQAQAANEQPVAQPTAKTVNEEPKEAVSKPKQQSDVDAFLAWLMQPFQLTLAILIPLLLAAIIWYVLYVRRLNREHLGPYNGALQAAEKDKNDEANQEPQALSAYEEAEQAAADEASEIPEFERIDDAVDLDATTNEQDEATGVMTNVTDDETFDDAADNFTEAESLDSELEQLGAASEEQPASNSSEAPEDDDLDALLSSGFDDDAAKENTAEEQLAEEQLVEEQSVTEQAADEPSLTVESELDNTLDFDLDPAEKADTETTVKADTAAREAAQNDNDDEMSLDFVIDEPSPKSSTAQANKADDFSTDGVELEQFENINLDDLDLEGLSADEPVVESTDSDEGYLEIDDLLADADSDDDYQAPRFEREAGQVDDEETPSGMLDLARAYIELDEYELARAELAKVDQTDDEEAKREAAMLLQKLDEQGH